MSEQRYLMAALIPPILVVGLLAGGTAKERIASRQARLISANQTKDLSTLPEQIEAHYAKVRSDQDTYRRMYELARSARELEERFQTFSVDDEVNQQVLKAPGAQWQAAEISKNIAEQSEPILAEIERIFSAEVQADWNTSDSFAWLISNQIRSAVFQGDREGTLRALGRLQKSANSDISFGYPSHARRLHRAFINQSLAIGFWDKAAELQELREQVSQPLDLEGRWQQMMRQRGVQIRTLLEHDETDSAVVDNWRHGIPFGIPGETELRWVRELENMQQLSSMAGTVRHVRTVAQKTRKSGAFEKMSITGVPYADCEQYGSNFIGRINAQWALAQDEFERRMTLTAIGVKQFQLQEGRWPKTLAELAKVGLTPQDWHYEPSQPFFYDVRNAGSVAVVWVDRSFQRIVDKGMTLPEVPEHLRSIHHIELPIR